MESFTWMECNKPEPRKAATLAIRKHDLKMRAELLARLGYPMPRAEARLQKNLVWEYELVGKPLVQKELAAIVKAAYQTLGTTPVRAPKAAKKKAQKNKR